MSDTAAKILRVDPAVAALGGTAITALFAYFQQRGQRASEEQRLDKQLRHERELEDRAHLRSVIEEAASRFETARARVIELLVAVEEEYPLEERARIRQAADEALWQGRIMTRLLDLRVEFTAPLRQAYDDAILALGFAYSTARSGPLAAADDFALDEHMRDAMRSLARFTFAAQQVIGVELNRQS